MRVVSEVEERADAFLFGRWTYGLFAGHWGVKNDLKNPVVGALNTRPKYWRRLRSPTRAPVG